MRISPPACALHFTYTLDQKRPPICAPLVRLCAPPKQLNSNESFISKEGIYPALSRPPHPLSPHEPFFSPRPQMHQDPQSASTPQEKCTLHKKKTPSIHALAKVAATSKPALSRERERKKQTPSCKAEPTGRDEIPPFASPPTIFFILRRPNGSSCHCWTSVSSIKQLVQRYRARCQKDKREKWPR